MTTTRWWMIAGALVVAALVAVSMALPASAIEVDTAAVARGAMRVTVDEEGRTRLRDRYIVAAPVAGRICPRSSTNTTLLSVSLLLTKGLKRFSVSGSLMAAFPFAMAQWVIRLFGGGMQS